MASAAASSSPVASFSGADAVRSGLEADSGVLNRPCYRIDVSNDASRAAESEIIVVIGHKSELESAFSRLSSLTEGTGSLLATMIADVAEPATEPVTRETYMGCRIFVVMLPSKCSRHNSRAQPVAVAKALTAIPFSGPCMVIVANDSNETVLARTIAAAKAFPMYTRKTGNAAKAMRRSVITLIPHSGEGELEDAAIKSLQQQVTSTRIAAALVDAPASELHTDAFVDIALRVAGECGATSMSVIRGEDLKSGGFGGLWGVGKAAAHPPALVVLEYNPTASSETPSVCLVGKGIVYDTGGLSLKTPASMPGMKRDMGGAAAVLGAFRSIAMAGGPTRVAALLCLAENSVSSVAMRPDDILHMYSGKTVEVNNTDAEGRLVLADGVAYAAKNLNPSVIIDIATLTGAQGIATGRHFAALYCNSEELEAVAVSAGKAVGEMTHPLPYAPEFFQKEFASSVADMKNSVKDRANASSSCAGQFIGSHMSAFVESKSWLHVDIAYPSFAGERATGFGAALLTRIVADVAATMV